VNRNIAIIIVTIVAIALGVVAIAPMMAPEESMITVSFYDSTGKMVYEVASGPKPFGFAFGNKDGVIVTDVMITTTYTVSGLPTGVAVSVLGQETTIVRLRSPTGGIVNTKTPSWTESDVVGSHKTGWTLSNIITPMTETDKTYGWQLECSVTLTATAVIEGKVCTTSKSIGAVSVTVNWVSLAAGFSITGTIGVVLS
jgi:hypothetical protein